MLHKVWPGLSVASMLPITSALDLIWEEFQAKPPTLDPVDWRVVEITCMLERLMAYATTGNSAFLPVRLMKALGAYQSLTDYGVPSFSHALQIHPRPSIQIKHWPLHKGKAILNSESSIAFHYNRAVASVSTVLSSHRWPVANGKQLLTLSLYVDVCSTGSD